MKWINHKISTFSFVFFLTDNILWATLATIGSVFPDMIEGEGFKKEKDSKEFQRWQKRHRRLSHLFILYFIVLVISYAIIKFHFRFDFLEASIKDFLSLLLNNETMKFLSIIVFFFTVGCCCHILQDALCGKVPILSFKHRIGIKLFRVGSATEYILVWFISLIFVFWRYK